MKGKKEGKTIVLETEPPIVDGTEVEVVLPTEWEAERNSLLSVGYYPHFGQDIEEAQNEWTPKPF